MVEPDDVIEHTIDRERQRVEDLMEGDGINHAEVRSDVQKSMTATVNVFREEEGIKEALRDIRRARERYEGRLRLRPLAHGTTPT